MSAAQKEKQCSEAADRLTNRTPWPSPRQLPGEQQTGDGHPLPNTPFTGSLPPQKGGRITYVSGTICQLCVGPLTASSSSDSDLPTQPSGRWTVTSRKTQRGKILKIARKKMRCGKRQSYWWTLRLRLTCRCTMLTARRQRAGLTLCRARPDRLWVADGSAVKIEWRTLLVLELRRANDWDDFCPRRPHWFVRCLLSREIPIGKPRTSLCDLG